MRWRWLAAACAAAALVAACAVRVPHSVPIQITGPAGTLAGSLYLPDGHGPHPAIVLVHTARRNSRLDYAQEARFFAACGVAALAYDKRGTGGSQGDLTAANFEFLARDAIAAAHALHARREIDSTRIGYWGMGQGGWIAPIAAGIDTATAFLVLLSAPIVSPLDWATVMRREALIGKKMNPEDASDLLRLRRRVWEYWLAPQGSGTAASDSLHAAFTKARGRPWFPAAVVARDLPESLIVDEGMGPNENPARWWFRDNMPAFWSLLHDPVAVLGFVRAPVLAIYGQKDATAPSPATFKAAAGSRADVKVFAGADDLLLVRRGKGLFQRLETAPGYRDTLRTWLVRVARPGKGPLRPPFRP